MEGPPRAGERRVINTNKLTFLFCTGNRVLYLTISVKSATLQVYHAIGRRPGPAARTPAQPPDPYRRGSGGPSPLASSSPEGATDHDHCHQSQTQAQDPPAGR